MLPKSVTIEIEGNKEIIAGWKLTQKQVDEIGKNFQLDANYVNTTKKPKVVEINHLNRLKSAWNRNKEQGLADYITWLDNNNKRMNAIFEDLQLKQVDNELLEIAKKGGLGFWDSLMKFLFAFINIFLPKKVA